MIFQTSELHLQQEFEGYHTIPAHFSLLLHCDWQAERVKYWKSRSPPYESVSEKAIQSSSGECESKI